MPRATARDEITIERLDAAILYLAECVLAHGPEFVPFLDKLERERERLVAAGDPVARARAIVEQARANKRSP